MTLKIGSYKIIPKSLTVGSIVLKQNETIVITRTNSIHTTFIRNNNNKTYIIPTASLSLSLLERIT